MNNRTEMTFKLNRGVIFPHIKVPLIRTLSHETRSADTHRIYQSKTSWLQPNHGVTIKLTKLKMEGEKFISKLQV